MAGGPSDIQFLGRNCIFFHGVPAGGAPFRTTPHLKLRAGGEPFRAAPEWPNLFCINRRKGSGFDFAVRSFVSLPFAPASPIVGGRLLPVNSKGIYPECIGEWAQCRSLGEKLGSQPLPKWEYDCDGTKCYKNVHSTHVLEFRQITC